MTTRGAGWRLAEAQNAKRLALGVVLILSSGCVVARLDPLPNEYEHAATVKPVAVKALKCTTGLKIQETDNEGAMPWLATGCGRRATCREDDQGFMCFLIPAPLRAFGDRPPEGYDGAALAVSSLTGCAAPQAQVLVASPKQRNGTAGFTASICDRDFACTSVVNRSNDIVGPTTCDETDQSTERTATKMLIDRLVVETSCPPANVELVTKTAWVRGTERTYRLNACGKPYVCTTASGRSDCKAALAQEAASPIAAP